MKLMEGEEAKEVAQGLGVGSMRPWPLNIAARALPGMNGGGPSAPVQAGEVYVLQLLNWQRLYLLSRWVWAA